MIPILEPADDRLRIDVVSDVVCPWCYIGKRQLDAALNTWTRNFPDRTTPRVRWFPFQLNPGMPEEGMDRAAYMQAKFGSRDPVAIYQRVNAAARAAGLDLQIERIGRQPNTLRAHGLIAGAPPGHQSDVVEALFHAYFIEGVDVGSDDALAQIGRMAGLSDDEAQAALVDGGRGAAQLDAEIRGLGVSGVPLFVFDGKRALSGAQGAEALYEAMQPD